MSIPALITYEGLPKSSGGAHSLRTKSSAASWCKIKTFVEACFANSEPFAARLDVKKPLQESRLNSSIDYFVNRFGEPISGQDSSVHYLNWFLDEGQLDETLSVIDSLPEHYKDEYGRQLIYVIVKASRPRLRGVSGAVLPNQGAENYGRFEGEPDRLLGECYFDAELGKRSFIYAFLSLPFEEPDTGFARYAEFLQEKFPCAMSRSSWKIWRLAKSGRSYVGRKMKSNW